MHPRRVFRSRQVPRFLSFSLPVIVALSSSRIADRLIFMHFSSAFLFSCRISPSRVFALSLEEEEEEENDLAEGEKCVRSGRDPSRLSNELQNREVSGKTSGSRRESVVRVCVCLCVITSSLGSPSHYRDPRRDGHRRYKRLSREIAPLIARIETATERPTTTATTTSTTRSSRV